MRRSGWRETLLILMAAFAAIVAFAARGDDPGARLFSESCSACHTIGQGDGAGPDLLPATRKSKDVLRIAVKRMEDNVGPLTDAQIDSLVALLKAPDVKHRLAALAGGVPEPATAPLPRGSEANGRRLFFGEQALKNGGSPCFACHAVHATGGSLAADLTAVQARLSPAALTLATAKPPFPMMKAAYAHHPVTEEEALDLAAFLESPVLDSAAKERPPTRALPLRVAALAVSFAGVMFGGVALLSRLRRAGVRARLVRDSER